MVKHWLLRLEQSLGGAAIIIAVASVLSRVVGLLRDRILYATFGAGQTLDIYYSAFRIPDLLFNLLVLGALSAAFIPLFLQEQEQHGKAQSVRFAGVVLNWMVLGLAVIGALAALAAVPLAQIMFPGASPEEQLQIAHFSRIMLLSTVFFGMSNVASGVLQSGRRFLSVSLAPILYNLGIILGAVVGVHWFGPIGLAYGVVAGAALHFLVQLPSLLSSGFKFTWGLDRHNPILLTLLKLTIPRSLALGVAQLNIMVMYGLASYLSTGSRAVWAAADNIQQVPINVFGVSMAVAAFPVFSAAFVKAKPEQFKQTFSASFRRVSFFVIPLSIAILLLRAQFVRLIYGTGHFGWEDTYLVAQTVGAFSLALLAQALIPLLARSFFAQKNTKTPVVVSIISVVVNIAAGLLLAPYFGIVGLALAFAIGSLVNMLLLLAILRVQFGDLDDDKIVDSLVKIVLLSAVSGVVIHGLKYFLAPIVDMTTYVGVFMQTAGAFLGGAAVYLAVAILFRFEEVDMVHTMLINMRAAVTRVLKNDNSK